VGRGYVVTRDVEKRLGAFLRSLYPLIIAGAAFAGAVLTRFGSRGVPALVALIVLMVVLHEGRVRHLLQGARRAPARGRGDVSGA
jgi:hypothetical protein